MADEPMDDRLSRPSPDPTVLTVDAVNSAVRQAKEYTDGQVAVLKERLRGIDTATQVLDATVTQVPTDVQQEVGHLRELTEEKLKGIEVVFEEQRRATHQAERERDNAASALRIELSRAIEEGDRNLRDHIQAQVAQIQASLESANLLEQERTARIAERVEAERRVAELTRELSDLAISKAESAAVKQFDEFSRTVEAQITALRDAMQDLTRRLDRLV